MEFNQDEKIILINLLQHEIEYTEDEIFKTHDKELTRYCNKLENLISKLRKSL